MLKYEEALSTLLGQVPLPQVAEVSIGESVGKVLAEPVVADLDLPSFDRAAMDGYAVRSRDVGETPVQLSVVGLLGAGSQAQPQVGSGEAVQIMTGAAVPAGADAVQMIEKTRRISDRLVEILETVTPEQNVSRLGSEVKKSSTVLERGRVIGPAEGGVLAAFGYSRLKIYRAPCATIVSTGDEVVEIDQRPQFGQIRNSNGHMLAAQCRDLGVKTRMLSLVRDDREEIRQAIATALKTELVLFSGGVSMGEFDYVQKSLVQEGVKIFFHKVAVKPGKPIVVGKKGEKLIFGLPGNPVSAFVTFELFVRPALKKWMGFEQYSLRKVRAKLMKPVVRKPGRIFFKAARTYLCGEGAQVEPIDTRGSADLVAFSRADSLLVVGADVSRLEVGHSAEVLLLSDYFQRGRA